MKTNTDPNSHQGIFVVQEHRYLESNTAVRFLDRPAAPGVTVGWIDSEIRHQRRQKGDMNEGHMGCRWWIYARLIVSIFDRTGSIQYVRDARACEEELCQWEQD
jgi:hypothetical protein